MGAVLEIRIKEMRKKEEKKYVGLIQCSGHPQAYKKKLSGFMKYVKKSFFLAHNNK